MYDKQWYEPYAEYLQEKSVRVAHDKILKLFRTLLYDEYGQYVNVVDLGCGLCEYAEYGLWQRYCGIDKNKVGRWPEINAGGYSCQTVEDDYLRPDIIREVCPFDPDVFVSLFSTELYLPDKYTFYQQLFQDNPSIKYGLVSGSFSVEKQKHNFNPTTEDQLVSLNNSFDEWRIYLRVNSIMFGDEIEVWKIFTRK